MSDVKNDIEIIQDRVNPLKDQATEEVLTIMLGEDEYEDDVVFGRASEGLDESEFDAMPREEWDLTPEQAVEFNLYQGANPTDPSTVPTTTSTAGSAQVLGDDEVETFESPVDQHFPLFKRALTHFQAAEAAPRVVRIDTDATYGELVGDTAIKELARRLDEVRAFVEQHVSDHHGGPAAPMRQWTEVIGAAEAVNALRAADTSDEAADALPQVPLDLPPFAQGKVKCWLDGDDVVVSMKFCAADGTPRYASMAARPRVNDEEVVGWAMRSGVNPVTVLGVLPDLAAAATGKRLVRDVAGAALAAQRRLDVVGMTDDGDDAEPVLLASGGDESTAPLAALMYVQQLADTGHEQASNEMNLIRAAAETPSGQEIAKPILDESTKRLEAGRAAKRVK